MKTVLSLLICLSCGLAVSAQSVQSPNKTTPPIQGASQVSKAPKVRMTTPTNDPPIQPDPTKRKRPKPTPKPVKDTTRQLSPH